MSAEAPSASSEATTAQRHVVVIGAGLSGLVVARTLIDQGVEVTVVEARDRVGGRLKPLENHLPLDAGGEFSSPAQRELHALAAELGIEWVPLKENPGAMVTLYGGDRRVEDYPFATDEETGADVAKAAELIDGYARRLNVANPASTEEGRELDALTVRQWAERNLTSERARVWLEKESAPDGSADQISMLSFVWLVARHGGWEGLETMAAGHFVGGSAQIPLRLAELVGDRIRLSTIVTGITQTDAGVTVQTDHGPIDADAVIVATSGNATGIRFEPELPDAHRALAESWIPLKGSKWFAKYDHPFWVEAGLNGVALGSDLLHPAIDISMNEGDAILCGMLFAPDAADPTISHQEWKRRIVEELIHMYGSGAATPEYVEIEHWAVDRWSAGPGNALPPGALTAAGDAVTQPFGRIAWAGADRGATDYMEGAINAGKRAASQLLDIVGANRI
ncbi:MAG TPA: FAD-dependent oxidoreductase [Pseudolysinimonas sp.]|nr:FAD-dependent oxidoreductase [Pseudolysinimonas sp.]